MPDRYSEEKLMSRSLDDLSAAAHSVISFFEKDSIWAFYGEMGVGKTTLIKEICRNLGVEDAIHSPTYSLVNEYIGQRGEKIYHFDFYRLKTEWEALDIGVEEYFYSGNLCLIEWPEKLGGLLPERSGEIRIENQSGIRTIWLRKHEQTAD